MMVSQRQSASNGSINNNQITARCSNILHNNKFCWFTNKSIIIIILRERNINKHVTEYFLRQIEQF